MTDKNAALLIAYDGRPFFGWQRHPGKPTVQGAIEDALAAAVGAPCTVEGSGRTDRGAHAEGQVASVRVPAGIDIPLLPELVRPHLAEGLEILAATDVPDDFHARQAATGKTYRYEIYGGKDLPPELDMRVWHIKRAMDPEIMGESARFFVGTKDFATFAANAGFKRRSTTRKVTRADVTSDGPRITVTFEADSFLYKMVRNLVRALAKVGEGRAAPEDILDMLDAKDRNAAPGTAPASGLYLQSVRYKEPLFEANEPKAKAETKADAPEADAGERATEAQSGGDSDA